MLKCCATSPLSTPELHFIQTSRNRILKAGAFPGLAIYTESSTGEDSNPQITGTSYELAYYDESGERHDLEEPIRGAIREAAMAAFAKSWRRE